MKGATQISRFGGLDHEEDVDEALAAFALDLPHLSFPEAITHSCALSGTCWVDHSEKDVLRHR